MSGLAHPPHQPPRYATLDGLRGAAALMVALFHLQVSLGAEPVRGYLAVDLFFGISGFVLAAAYVERFRMASTPWHSCPCAQCAFIRYICAVSCSA